MARHGKAVVPLLMALLSDDPNAERDRKRWKVQQQVALTLSRIYSESQHCGRTYCDGDPPERIARVREGWLRVIASDKEMQALSARELLDRFKEEKVFWRQFEIGQALAAANDRGAIAELEAWLTHDDRHVRGNVAFVLGRLGDPRGFETIAEILADRSPRSAGQGIPGGNWSVQAQIRADRYYAAHLLGDLKDPRGVELLIPLLNDEDVDDIVPWSLAEIGDRRAIGPLIGQTGARRSFGAGAGDLRSRKAEGSRGVAKATRVAAGRQEIQFRRPYNRRRSGQTRDRGDLPTALSRSAILSPGIVGFNKERLTPRGGPRQRAVVGAVRER